MLTSAEKVAYRKLPFVTGIFFHQARCFDRTQPKIIRLEKVWRQADAAFIAALNEVRSGKLSPRTAALLNGQVTTKSAAELQETMWCLRRTE